MDLTTWPVVSMINQKNYYTWVGVIIVTGLEAQGPAEH